jgi:hypothetical protein
MQGEEQEELLMEGEADEEDEAVMEPEVFGRSASTRQLGPKAVTLEC